MTNAADVMPFVRAAIINPVAILPGRNGRRRRNRVLIERPVGSALDEWFSGIHPLEVPIVPVATRRDVEVQDVALVTPVVVGNGAVGNMRLEHVGPLVHG